ncbi:hypothetical protein TVAG_371640 [Trichomonas vaginalis G3]|uniref:Uncharacterized protein n=1 Tax=Trichomonas vaginalis (strain ATCC PRA-98 / G3) TaxID=412133 RepID=A2E0T5_TRIV3|nr:hypothetical protein TVAGG3_0325550 [Trichomonas vaginalis G3]EAY13690.1 hypothetical protein TVAG_371640 [Trichomonas vaginalis G3]KAI5529600.1 hypothetical protein TVAGG3_0325550 [Trichomonas vaginalis G3]|eukprot:XP_001325913.1 hypothetical protein [Trichomonas vaginalis G3]
MHPLTGKTFTLHEFGILSTTPRRYRSNGNLEDLLHEGTELLKLNSPAKYVYLDDGTLVKSLSDVPSGSNLYLSIKKQSQLKLQNSPSKIDQNDLSINNEGTFTPRSLNLSEDSASQFSQSGPRSPTSYSSISTPSKFSLSSPMSSSTISAPKGRSPSKLPANYSPEKALIPEVKESPYVRYHQLLISLPGTTEDQLIYSMLNAYTTVPVDLRVNASEYENLENLLRRTQHRLFEKLLISELIVPITAESIVNNPVYERCCELLDEKKLETIKLAILGPRHSGKTVVLHVMAELFYRKIQLCDDADTVFMFPFNFQKYVDIINNGEVENLYKSIMRILMDSLLFSKFEIWNFYQQIKEWFLCIPMVGSLLSIPQEMERCPFIDTQMMRKVGKKLHSDLHNNLKSPNEVISTIISSIPDFAKIFHFKTTCFIIDHVCETQNGFSGSIANAIGDSPYIVSGVEDSKFKSNFKKDFTPIIIEDFIELDDKRRINFCGLFLSIDDCHGLPGVVHLFDDAFKEIQKTSQEKKSFAMFKSRASICSALIANQKVLLLCECIKEFNHSEELLSAMDELSEGTAKLSIEV